MFFVHQHETCSNILLNVIGCHWLWWMSSTSASPRYCSGMALNVSHAGAVYSSPDYGALVNLCRCAGVIAKGVSMLDLYSSTKEDPTNWMDGTSAKRHISLVSEPILPPAPSSERPARCVSCWCCTCVFGAWWDFHFSFQVPPPSWWAFSGVWDVGVNLPKMAEKNLMSFFWFWMAGYYQPPPLFIMKNGICTTISLSVIDML